MAMKMTISTRKRKGVLMRKRRKSHSIKGRSGGSGVGTSIFMKAKDE